MSRFNPQDWEGPQSGQAFPPPYEEAIDPCATFWEHNSRRPVPRFGPDDVLIGVMGMTGAGKSSFISKTMGVEMEIGHGLKSCTKEIGVATSMIDGRQVHLIDTPGFDDTEIKDSDILDSIAGYLTSRQSRRIRLSGIIFIHRISDNRVGGTAHRNLRLFRKVVGDSSMGNVVLPAGMAREKELAESDEFFGQMLERGARCDRYDCTRRDGRRIVKELLPKVSCVLRIQRELERGLPIANTAAGMAVSEQLRELHIKHEREMRELRREVATERDARAKEYAQRQIDSLREEMDKAARAKARLHEARIINLQKEIRTLQQQQGPCVIL